MHPAAPQPEPGPGPSPGSAPPAGIRPWVWITTVLAVVVIAAGAAGAYAIFRATHPSGPASAKDLSALLVDAPGKTSTTETTDAKSDQSLTGGARGVRWSATRLWHDAYTPGSIVLTQFDSAKDASAALTALRGGLDTGTGTMADVPGLPGGFAIVNPSPVSPPGAGELHSIIAAAYKGSIGVAIFTATDSVDWVQALLVKQINALP